MRYLEKTEFLTFSKEVQSQVQRIFAHGADECFITTCGGVVIVTETRPALIQPVHTYAIHAKTLYTPEERDELFKRSFGFVRFPSFASKAKNEKAAAAVDIYHEKHIAVELLKDFVIKTMPHIKNISYFVKSTADTEAKDSRLGIIGEYVSIEYKGGGVREIDVTATSIAYIGIAILQEVA